MRLAAIVAAIALALAPVAEARTHHRNYVADPERPADCYGIPWCGCWLRHEFGMANKALNLAAKWMRMGAPATPANANVVVWPSHHHVGKVLAYRGGNVLVKSGNSYHGRMSTRWVRVKRGFVFRRV